MEPSADGFILIAGQHALQTNERMLSFGRRVLLRLMIIAMTLVLNVKLGGA